MNNENLISPLTVLRGIGDKKNQAFAAAGINTVADLLEYYPRRYEFYKYYSSPAEINERGNAVFSIVYDGTATRQYAKTVGIFSRWRIKTGTRDIIFTWFNQPYILNALEKGKKYCFKCTIEFKKGIWQAVNPKFSGTKFYTHSVLEPVYTPISGIGSAELMKFIGMALGEAEKSDYDVIPEEIRKKYSIPGYAESLRSIHTPKTEEDCIYGNRRLIFEEFFMFRMRQRLSAGKRSSGDASMIFECGCVDEFKGLLPYPLTNAQNKAIDDILRDLLSRAPMNRIVQGDVGSGKTAVAFCACLMAKRAGYQTIIMVPTEVLARQHIESFQNIFKNIDISVGLLVGAMKQNEKRQVLADFTSMNIDVLIGTHAVLEDGVESGSIGLVITDEQHRFGVRQRLNLKSKGKPVNMLVLTATPIPRTLSMVIYGDLDVSIIDEMPPDRIPIRTYAVNSSMRERIYKFVEAQVNEGHQAYIICPLIDNDDDDKASVKAFYAELSNNQLANVRLGMLYGSMKPQEKEEVMSSFARGDTDVLISTTVIEVGINVPNATVMVIEDADKFGLAQLHQLRGRVGRGKWQSHCVLISDATGETAVERLTALVKNRDGFKLAIEDMRLRGQGEYFGLRQSGASGFAHGVLPRDTEIFTQAADAVDFVANNRDEFGEYYNILSEKARILNEETIFN